MAFRYNKTDLIRVHRIKKEDKYMKERTAAVDRRKVRSLLVMLGVVLTLVFAVRMFSVNAFAQEDDLTLSITGNVEGGGLGAAGQMIESGSINIRFGSGEDGYRFNASLDLGDTSLISLLAAFTEEGISFQIPQADENVYQMSLEKVGEYVQELMVQLQQMIGENSPISNPEQLIPSISGELIQEALQPVLEVLSAHIPEAVAVESGEDVILEGLSETVSGCEVYTYHPTAEQLEAIVNDLAAAMESNDALDQLVKEIADYIRGLDGVLTTTSAISGETMDAQESADALEEGYAQLAAALKENAAAFAQAVEESDGEVRIAVAPDGSPCLVEVTFEVEEQQGRAALELLPAEDLAFYLGLRADDQEMALRGRVAEDDDKISGNFDLTVPEMGTPLTLTFEVYPAELSRLLLPYGFMQLDLMDMTVRFDVEPSESVGADVLLITCSGLESFDENGSEDPVRGFTLRVEASGEDTAAAPEGPVVDISDYSSEELGQLFSGIAESVVSYFTGE